ncbi:MAG: transcriptional regulator with XRE-family HTH domain [Flavobacteriales bacterium]|jgi:transcriptional regulator with XRE-family HTH domain
MSKLSEYREKQNLTQDDLAEKSGVSVRTIQRIEAGAHLKGHTLKVIASALKLDPSLLSAFPKEENAYNYPLIKMINLSSLLFFIPLCNIMVPLLIMHFAKQKNHLTRQIVSVQIMWTLASFVLILMSPFIQKWFSLNRQLILLVAMACFLVNIFIILRNTMGIDKTKELYIKLNFSII